MSGEMEKAPAAPAKPASAPERAFPLLPIAFLVMFTLKLAGIGVAAQMSWWWVTLPLWLPVAGMALFFAGLAAVVGVFMLAALVVSLVQE